MKLGFINGMRGVAILGVVFHHLFFRSVAYGIGGEMSITGIVASSGWLGVNLFFFLSGFVLYLPYARRQRSIEQTEGIVDFYKRRFHRLYPLYVLLAFISLLFVYKGEASHRWAIEFMLVTFPFRESTFMPAPNWVLWSIGVEIWFSILFPLVALSVIRRGFGKVFLFCIPVSLVVRIVGQEYFGNRDAGDLVNFVSDSVVGRLDDFLFGMYAAHAFHLGSVKRMNRYLSCAASLVCIAGTLMLWALWYRKDLPQWSAALFSLPLNVGLLLFTTRVVTTFRGIRSALQIGVLQIMGLMCYSIYVWHGIILNKMGASVSYVITLLFMSLLTYRFVEFGAEPNWRKLLPLRG